ncbi:MAG: hypothetical protein EOP09_02180 [Proteobacteria bacterium]|nr:MAG: hypothetical protein EOP09_02180 [Pseudomonadota bacterium]
MKKIILPLLALFAISPAFASAPLDCFKKASVDMDQMVAVRLCAQTENADAPIECLREAKSFLPIYESVGLCSASKNAQETLRCYREAVTQLTSIPNAAIRLCGGNTN